MTICTVGHVFTIPTKKGSSMSLILIGGFFMTGSASLATDMKIRGFFMRKGVFVDVAVQAFHPVMHRMRDVFRNDCVMFPGFMTFDAGIIVYVFVLLLFFLRNTKRYQKYTHKYH
jgi:hypothetical protein